jgi:hypothetical protein
MLKLPKILSWFTGQRYKPEIIWSSNSLTHNIFRLYEMIFGRKVGIRIESSIEITGNKITRKVYTFEAACAEFETLIRKFFEIKWLDIKVVEWQFALPSQEFKIPMFSFVIAFDSAITDASGNTKTCTGSNLMLTYGRNMLAQTQPTTLTATYAAVSMVKQIGQQQNNGSSFAESSMWFLANPATGANTLSTTQTAGTQGSSRDCASSYTGCQSTTTADATGSASGNTSGAKTASITTVANNAWIVAAGVLEGSGNSMSSPTYTSRFNNQTSGGTDQGRSSFQDTNGAITPAGVQAIGWTMSAAVPWAIVAASFGPFTPTVYTMNTSPATFAFTPQTEANHKIVKMITSPVSFAFTGISTGMNKVYTMVAQVISFLFTGKNQTSQLIASPTWSKSTKGSDTWATQQKS